MNELTLWKVTQITKIRPKPTMLYILLTVNMVLKHQTA